MFAADLIPTTAHVDEPWIMAYDLYPMETLAFKRSFVREAIRAGAGIGLLPTYLADPDVDRGWLSRVLPRWSIPAGHLWIVLPGARQVPRKVAALREFALLALKARPLGPRSE